MVIRVFNIKVWVDIKSSNILKGKILIYLFAVTPKDA